MFLGSLNCDQCGPRSDCSLGRSVIRVHSVCFLDKILSEVQLNLCSRCKKQTTSSQQKKISEEVGNILNLLYPDTVKPV